jgi:hypothetical protein
MKISTIEIRKLTATEGMFLTNGETYSKEVYLGINDNPDNWHEITAEEYNEIQTAIEEQHNFDTMKEGEV